MNNLRLTGIASCVPKNTVKISEFYDLFGKKEVERIATSTGIKEVRIADKGIRASDLCMEAALKLIDELSINKNDIDAIIFISQTPDFIMPATSCILQDRLGLKKSVIAFDINYGCSGYIYGLLQAALVANSIKGCNKVLLCVGDTISKYLNPNDHKSRLVFGDGGSATIIESGKNTWDFAIGTDGSGFKDLIIPNNDIYPNLENDYLHLNGASIMEFALREVKDVVDRVLLSQRMRINDVSAVILHQANLFMLQYLGKKLNVPKDMLPIKVEKYGNTGPASIPITLCSQYFEKDQILDKVVLAGFGVGLSWGSVLLSLRDTHFTKVYEL